MKIILFIATFLIILTNPINAERNTSFGLQTSLNVSTGSLTQWYDRGYGLNGTIHYRLSPDVHITGSIGYYRWREVAPVLDMSYSLVMLPILAGVRYTIFDVGNLYPYAHVDVGPYFFFEGVSINGRTDWYTELDVGIGLVGGVMYSIGSGIYLDAGVRYTNTNILSFFSDKETIQYFGFRAGVRIGF